MPKYPTRHIRVLHQRWRVKVLPRKAFNKKYSRMDQAISEPAEKAIYLRLETTTREDIIHELTHAYLDELGLGESLNLSLSQAEELFCEFTAKWGFIMLLNAEEIYSDYLALKKRYRRQHGHP